MDRAETTGLGVALAGHGALLAALVFLVGTRLPPLPSQPIEVSFVGEAGLVSTAPDPSREAPAPSVAPELGTPAEAAPQPREALAPPAASPAPAPSRAAPARAQPNRPAPAEAPRGSRLGADFLKGLSGDPSTSRSQAVPGAAIGDAVRSSLGAEVRRQLKPHWKAPTGADAALLRTQLSIWLARDGSVTRVEVIGTTGQTASNRPQVKLHQEQAVRAVRLASPFRLPAEYYDAWKHLSPIGFDKRLSQ